MTDFYDLIVIGAGPGGYEAAIRSAQLGFKTLCVDEREQFGGTCLNIGCIPSKTLLHTTELYQMMKVHGNDLGFDAKQLELNYHAMMERKEVVVKSLTDGVASLFKKYGVEGIHGHATLIGSDTVDINGNIYQTKKILLASGSTSIPLPFLPFDEDKILSSTGALALQTIPKSMIVVGAGVIGLEMASVFSRLGTQVTLVEMLDRIGGNLDETVHKHFLQLLKKQGLTFLLSTQVKKGEIKSNHIELTIETNQKQEVIQAEKILVAIGRKPFSTGLGLEKIGVEKTEKGFVKVDQHFQTNVPSIYAIGDLIEGPMLAHRASEEGVVLVEHLNGLASKIDYMTIPSIIYTHPEVASVGFTEKEAKASGLQVLTGTCFMKANPRARCIGDTEGLMKVIAEKQTQRIVGLHLLSSQASELIQEGVLAIENKMKLEDLANTSHGHPTLSESIKEACLLALERPINI